MACFFGLLFRALLFRQFCAQSKRMNLFTHQGPQRGINHPVPGQCGLAGKRRATNHRFKVNTVITGDTDLGIRQAFKYHLRYCCAIHKLSSSSSGHDSGRWNHKIGNLSNFSQSFKPGANEFELSGTRIIVDLLASKNSHLKAIAKTISTGDSFEPKKCFMT